MGMTTWVVGLRTKNDSTYQKHLKVLEACKAADIKELPQETAIYFGYKYPEDIQPEEVLQVKIPNTIVRQDIMTEGYEIKVSDIPIGVEVIRFCNSW